MDNEQLKPCPWCGKDPAKEWHSYQGGTVEIGCANPDCPMMEVTTGVLKPDRAKATWNSRPLEDALRAEVARLQTENDRTYCAYCGEAFIRDDQAASRVSEHIRTCEKHPMRKVELELHNSEMTRKWLSDENQRVRMLLMPILESEDPAEYVEKLQAELQQAREALKTILEIPLSEEDYFDDISIGYHAGVSSCKKIARAALPTPPEQEERPPYCQRCGAPVVWCMCKSTPPEQEANG